MTQRVDTAVLSAPAYTGLIAVETYIHGALDHGLLSLVKLRVSQINGCAYCLHMHRAEALKAGDSDARINMLNAWHESRMFTPRERAALKWAESLTHIASDRAEDDTYAAVKAEFSDQELSDLTMAVAMINAWNRISVSTRKLHPLDKPAAV